jgi:hypothetical protein
MTSGRPRIAFSKVSSAGSICRSSVTWMNTLTLSPTRSASSSVT